jgi:E3 SUMO-protein ligase PIAS1
VTSKAEDTEIQATASVLSLKCDISARRIATPCRSISCAHNQCFDAASYLQLQEQAPQWICPLCNRSAPYSNLTIDLYVDSILKSTSASIEQVTIETDGSWHQQKQAETPRRSYKNPTPEEDDLIEIRDDRISSLKAGARSSMPRGTPPMSSREPSSVPSASRSGKRPISEVIDLTISDEEEEQPPQKMIKRSSMSSLTNTDPYRVPSAPRFYFDMPSASTYTNSDYADSPI